MSRSKKQYSINTNRMESLPRDYKLAVFDECREIYHHELSKIPKKEMRILQDEYRKPEEMAKEYYQMAGYDVYTSRVLGGYRSIGIEFYWSHYKKRMTIGDKDLILKLKSILSVSEYEELAGIVKEKTGSPDLMLIKDKSIEFVEVKYNAEKVMPVTVEYFIRYGHIWPISIMRIINQMPWGHKNDPDSPNT